MEESKALKGVMTDVKVEAKEEEGLRVIDISHEKIHDGAAFAFLCEKTGLASGSTCWIAFLTNSAKNIHFRPAMLFSTASLAVAKLYEEPTITPATGLVVNTYNHFRPDALSKVSDVVVTLEPTILTEGARLPLTVFAGVGGGKETRTGGLGGAEDEWVLKPDTLYGIKIENIGDASTNLTITPF